MKYGVPAILADEGHHANETSRDWLCKLIVQTVHRRGARSVDRWPNRYVKKVHTPIEYAAPWAVIVSDAPLLKFINYFFGSYFSDQAPWLGTFRKLRLSLGPLSSCRLMAGLAIIIRLGCWSRTRNGVTVVGASTPASAHSLFSVHCSPGWTCG